MHRTFQLLLLSSWNDMDGKLRSDFARDSSWRAERTCRNTLRKPDITVSKRTCIIRTSLRLLIFPTTKARKIATDHVMCIMQKRDSCERKCEGRGEKREWRAVRFPSDFTLTWRNDEIMLRAVSDESIRDTKPDCNKYKLLRIFLRDVYLLPE